MTWKKRIISAVVPALLFTLLILPAVPVSAEYLNQAVTNTNDPDYWLDRGGLFATYGSYSAALKAYRKALDLDAGNSKAYYNMALAHAELGDFDPALSEIDKAISLDPESGRYYYGRAWIFLRAGKKAEAEKDFKKAAELGNSDARAYLNQ